MECTVLQADKIPHKTANKIAFFIDCSLMVGALPLRTAAPNLFGMHVIPSDVGIPHRAVFYSGQTKRRHSNRFFQAVNKPAASKNARYAAAFFAKLKG